MNKLAFAFAAIAMMSAPAAANAAACRDAKGHFIKCPPAATAHAAAPARHAPCRDAKGRFKKC